MTLRSIQKRLNAVAQAMRQLKTASQLLTIYIKCHTNLWNSVTTRMYLQLDQVIKIVEEVLRVLQSNILHNFKIFGIYAQELEL